jgi:hypothetical protein
VNHYKRSIRILLGTLAVYALLVATNLGEFWPFSIYPMFSQAGNPWSRALVRDVTEDREAVQWEPVSSNALPGRPYALIEYGVDPIDLANFVSKTLVWDAPRVNGLRTMFREHTLEHRDLLVLRVNGRFGEDYSVLVEYVPYVLLHADGNRLNEALRTDPQP